MKFPPALRPIVCLAFFGCLASGPGRALAGAGDGAATEGRTLALADAPAEPAALTADVGDAGVFTWWLPDGADGYVLPISAGVAVDAARPDLMAWLRDGSPWSLSELPALGARYGDRTLVVIVPWPHYAELVAEAGDGAGGAGGAATRVGVRFSMPAGRHGATPHGATPCGVVASLGGPDPLAVARAFRAWRRDAVDAGGIPRPTTLAEKAADRPGVARLFGAPHIYLWGPALFSKHDVPRGKWVAFARAIADAPADSVGGRLRASFADEQRGALADLASAEWPMDYLTVAVAGGIDAALSRPGGADADPDGADAESDGADAETDGAAGQAGDVDVVARNRRALAAAFADVVAPPDAWGDGPSLTTIDALHDAGVGRAVLLLGDLYARSPRPDVAARAERYGYLIGPYDSYHTVHDPDAPPDQTWETAQFDRAAYEGGRVVNADGTGHVGFKGRGFHLAPAAAWPHVRRRVDGILADVPYTAWFVDCDATAEAFDDYSPAHPATRADDAALRRRRLAWLASAHGLVVGSEGGSALFADVIDFGHGVQTPFIGHLDPAFRDPQGPHFLGRYWPPDGPDVMFKPTTVPPSLVTPYFDPAVRIPLYRAALGDEVVATHHWSFDSTKFTDVAAVRALMEIGYMVPPVYHLNRAAWPARRERIVSHLAFWGPLHEALAAAPLVRFEWLSDDHLAQRTTFRPPGGTGEVTITVNYGPDGRAGLPPFSATAGGDTPLAGRVYRATVAGGASAATVAE